MESTRGRTFQGKKTHTKAWKQERIGPRALHRVLYGWRVRFIGRGGCGGARAGHEVPRLPYEKS